MPYDIKSYLRQLLTKDPNFPLKKVFDAADRVGFYLQPEGPSWANHGSSLGDGKPIDQFIYDETIRMEQLYGNHPSYCMLAYGNEPRGGKQVEYIQSLFTSGKKEITDGYIRVLLWL